MKNVFVHAVLLVCVVCTIHLHFCNSSSTLSGSYSLSYVSITIHHNSDPKHCKHEWLDSSVCFCEIKQCYAFPFWESKTKKHCPHHFGCTIWDMYALIFQRAFMFDRTSDAFSQISITVCAYLYLSIRAWTSWVASKGLMRLVATFEMFSLQVCPTDFCNVGVHKFCSTIVWSSHSQEIVCYCSCSLPHSQILLKIAWVV